MATNKDIDLLSTAQDMWDNATQLFNLWEHRWAQNEMLVNSKHLTARKAGQSSLFIPKIETFLQTKMADHLFAFGGDDPVSLRPTLTSTKDGAAIMEAVVNHYLTDAGGINWPASVVNAASNALTYNFAPAVVDWDRGVEVEEVEVDALDEDGNEIVEVEKTERELYSNPTLEVIPPEDFRVDPAVGWDEIPMARYFSVRRWRDKAFADQMHKQGVWPKIDEGEFGEKTLSGGNQSLKNARAFQNSPFTNVSDIDNGLVDVRTYWFYMDLGDGYVPVTMTTLEDRIVLEEPEEMEIDFSNTDGTDPFPVVIGRIYVKPHEPVSRAMPEKLEQLQLEVNAVRNQRRDNVALALNPEKLVTPDAGVDPAVMSRSFAGKVNVVRNLNSVKWERAPDVTASAYNEESISTNDMERLVAESAQRAGGETSRKETATQAKITAAGGAKSAGFDASIFGMSFAEPAVRKIIKAIRQAAPIEIFDAAAKKVKSDVDDPYLEALEGDFRVIVSADAFQVRKDTAISNASNMAAITQSVYGPNARYTAIMAPMYEENGINPEDVIPADQLDPNNIAQQDLGGVAGSDNMAVQPSVQLQGGQFGAKDANGAVT